MERLPAEERAEARQLFDGSPNIAFASSSDPEIARQLGIINSIREIEMKPDLDKAERDRKAASDRQAAEISVLVALVPSLTAKNLRAQVVRRPDDGGQPLLLLRESDATSTDLARGLRAAAMSIKRHGVSPKKKVQMNLGAPRGSAARGEPGTEGLLNFVKSSAVRSIPGVGAVRANTIITRTPPSGQ